MVFSNLSKDEDYKRQGISGGLPVKFGGLRAGNRANPDEISINHQPPH
jgi:hypothetical protein